MSSSMDLDLLNVNKDIEMNGWLEVTSPKYFVSNTTELDPEGIFSIDIFGEPGTEDRKLKWGWVRLNDVFMNPHAYYVLFRLKKNIAEDMKTGTGKYYVDKTGELVKLGAGKTVPADAAYSVLGSGFDWLKEAWPHITWRTTKDMSMAAKTRRRFLKAFDIDAIFWDKFPICPAFYRDVDYKTSKRNVINKMYTKIINLAQILKNTSNLVFVDDPEIPSKSISYTKMQDAMNEIAEFFFGKIGGADGFINKHVVGKSTDYGARLVISCPSFNYERYTDVDVDFFHSSVPLAVAINIFAPFMIYEIKRWILGHVSGNRFLRYYDFNKKKFIDVEVSKGYIDEFSTDEIRRSLDLYKKSKIYRAKTVTIRGENGERIPIQLTFSYNTQNNQIILSTDRNDIESTDDPDNFVRNITYCELYYIIAYEALKTKCVDVTRYPMDDYYHIFPSLMNIIPAVKTRPVAFNGVVYPRYPILQHKNKSELEHMFIDSLKMFSINPSALGADFDGDQVSCQSLFADESNEEAIRQMNAKSNILGMSGKIFKELPKVVQHGLYGCTFMNKKPV